MDAPRPSQTQPAWSRWYWLLAIIPVAALWVPLYNWTEPTIFGFPYFYAFQLIWVCVSAAITAAVYIATRSSRQR